MRGSYLTFCIAVALAGSNGFAQSWTATLFDHTQHDFGTVTRGAKAEHAFVLQNRTSDEVRIAAVRSSCGCTATSIQDDHWSVAPGKATRLIASLHSASFVGVRWSTITVTFDKPARGEVQLHVKAYVRGDVGVKPDRVEFGSINSGTPAERTIQVSNSGRYSWGIVEVKCPHPRLSCKVTETRRDWTRVSYRVRVRLDEQAPPGYLRGHLILVTNEPHHRKIPVLVEARVLPEMSASPSTLFLGVVRPGEQVSRSLVVRAKKPFRITALQTDGEGLEVDLQAGKTPKPLHLIPVTFRAAGQPGKVVRTIHIETDLEGAALAVDASAVVASAEPPPTSKAAGGTASTSDGATSPSTTWQKPEPRSRVLRPLGGRFPILQRLFRGRAAASQSGGNPPVVNGD